ncbi:MULTISPECIES: alkaline shock response membrane anchor protein AmaP [Streptomyces]|uniref:Alkaline shock response membrane anchor protein AmaP n=1 Tax=Streptomyces caniscabiei TaxID=2746961 RepID=A0ABU4MFS6_9ACTN|nr:MULTISPECIES: alkaline shock response membrane anchor protein AmaP [Streptomyces]MBE4736289.1 alkaline shock response membrane anchor protein AmaP [Streptomyces caniscabiei]MBE4755583.1 alkaline shock response membrane anchor protein AmaP [Streptomyces caniscabiei]MBE4774319.1 alkaline shock response membrane anchor protein AmaP [Streptomyces caniscabiei]MBE4785744.1 alkaline shock response membrane anchor protein AmaP [Streptomyces caniscabiei]MBE4793765.1 alkaline shock response membrane 
MLRIVNRVLLGVVGLVLVVVGGAVLAVGLGVAPPSWWPYDGRGDVLLSDADRTRWRDSGWWWPTVIAVLAVLVLLALWWLTAVLRRHRLAEVLVDTGDGEGALLRGRALEGVLTAEAAGSDGVARAHARLTGRRTAPEARVRLLLQPHVNPGDALHTLTTEALAHARESAGLAALPAEVRLRGAGHRAERVS